MKPTPEQVLVANRFAKAKGTNRATKIVIATTPMAPVETDSEKISQRVFPRLLELDHYHAESRTGIRAGMAALKLFWSTYHYVPTYCEVLIADSDEIYSNDNHQQSIL